MDLLNADVQRRSRPILIRLTPDLHRRLVQVAQTVGSSMATTCRAILETALREGVNVINPEPEPPPPAPRRRRARPEAQVSA